MNAVITTLGTVLGLSSSLINLMPAVIAQPRPETTAPTSEISLSGDSLRNLEERTVDFDYQQFMRRPEPSSNSAGRGMNWHLEIRRDGFHLKIDRDLEIIIPPSDAQLLGDPVPPKPSDSGQETGVKLQLGL